MHEQLQNLYVEQRNVKKLFLLYFKAGELIKALKILNDIAYVNSDDFSVPMVQRVYDYCFADAIIGGKDNDCDIFNIVRRPSSVLAEVVIQRISEWIIAYHMIAQGRKLLMSGEFERLKDELVKNFFELHLFDHALVEDIEQLREAPFRILQTALNMVKHLSSSVESCQTSLALLLTEVLKIDRKANHFILLSWSSLRKAALKVKIDEYSRVATQ